MENLTEYRSESLQPLTNLTLTPFLVDEETSIANYEKISLSRLNSLGVAFEPISTAVQNVFGSSSGTTQLCKVTIPSGTHLASFKNGAGNLGTALNANNQIAGQAIINPLVCNPTMIFMAAALANIDKKLDSIQEIQQEMLEFLEQKEKSELRGDLKFLTDILDNYRYNWNNDMYKRSCHVKTLDIRQSASQKVDFYQKQITSKLQKKVFLHSDQDVKKQLEKISSEFKDYQLALYLFSFSSFIEVMLLGNYDRQFLSGITQKIEGYSFEYRDLYTRAYNQIENSSDSSVQSYLLRGLAAAGKATGEAIAKIPLISKSQLDENLISAGEKLSDYQQKRTSQAMKKLIDKQSSCVHPFIESIDSVSKLYNEPIEMFFDKDNLYLPA